MSIVLCGLMTRICLAYLDYVIVYLSHNFQNLRDLRAVFESLHVVGLKLKPSICKLFNNEVMYFGHVVNGDDVSADRLNVAFCLPDSLRHPILPRFHNFYGEFIHN